jgi:hypothetical protein
MKKAATVKPQRRRNLTGNHPSLMLALQSRLCGTPIKKIARTAWYTLEASKVCIARFLLECVGIARYGI